MATLISETAAQYRVRPARGNEIGELQNIDLASASLFRGTGLIDFGPLGEPTQPIPEDRLRRGFGDELIWVAVDDRDELVGFALCSDRGEDLYLDQLSVLPRHGRQGLGARLVRRCLQEAESRAFRRVSLSTFRKVAWNGPFYRKLGFREVPVWRLQDWQAEIRDLQRSTMDVRLRCFMQRKVKRASELWPSGPCLPCRSSKSVGRPGSLCEAANTDAPVIAPSVASLVPLRPPAPPHPA